VLFDFVDSVNFNVEDTGADFGDDRPGVVTPALIWQHSAEPAASVSMPFALSGALLQKR
jgi:hypothetical protein